MKVSEIDYTLPKELIAQHPIYPRDYARLMVLKRNDGLIQHKKFYQIQDYFSSGDILVLNNSKVIKARFRGFKKGTNGKREVFLLKEIENKKWVALTYPNSRVRANDAIILKKEPQITVSVIEKCESGENIVEFKTDPEMSMKDIFLIAGEVPLPPYIKGKLGAESEYQTVFSMQDGSVASPTAGLHFTKNLIDALLRKGVIVEYITLHVGLGTFQPISEEDIESHKIHEEEFFITEESADRINAAKKNGGKLFACGTTVVRALETASTREGILKPFSGKTRLFIKPGFRFKIVDAMITNFHFPRTTLLALVSAFAGKEFILKAYDIAVKEKYRFYSFGDAMLIL